MKLFLKILGILCVFLIIFSFYITRDGKIFTPEGEGEITLDVNGVGYEGYWSAIPLEGVISLDIVYTSPPTITVEEDSEVRSLPVFSMVLVLILLAMIVNRIRKKII